MKIERSYFIHRTIIQKVHLRLKMSRLGFMRQVYQRVGNSLVYKRIGKSVN